MCASANTGKIPAQRKKKRDLKLEGAAIGSGDSVEAGERARIGKIKKETAKVPERGVLDSEKRRHASWSSERCLHAGGESER